MSFASEAKAEICSRLPDRRCCARAECYGIVLYCNTFRPDELRIITANADFAARLPKLFRRAFGLGFDVLPPEDARGKRSFLIRDPEKLRTIYSSYGTEPDETRMHHINLAVLESDCCRVSFVRGAFLAGGSVTDPEKRYHLELSTPHRQVSREMFALLREVDPELEPKEATRGGSSLLYFKRSDAIADFLTLVGAGTTSLGVVEAKLEKEMRNTITRMANCDFANADKTVTAAQEQMTAIRRIVKAYGGLDFLPEPLQQAALLRFTNPEASLSDLALLSNPPVTRSCLAYRLKKIMSYVPEDEE